MRPGGQTTARHLVLVPALPKAATSRDFSLAEATNSPGRIGDEVRDLADRVGGLAALESLDTSRHSDDGFDFTSIAQSERELVIETLATVDRRASILVSDERRCIVRRLIARIAAHDAAALRATPTDLTAAGLLWLMFCGSGDESRGLAGAISAAFHVSTNCSYRGRALFKATGLPRLPPIRGARTFKRPDVWLADRDLLDSRARHELIVRRNQVIATLERQRTESVRLRP